MNACGTCPGTTMLPFTSFESRPLMMYSIASVTTRLGTRASVVMAPFTAPTVAPMATAITNPDHTGMCCDRNRSPTTNADRPSVDPTDRSMLRVTMTIVSPTPTSAIRDAPPRRCCILPLLGKLWFLRGGGEPLSEPNLLLVATGQGGYHVPHSAVLQLQPLCPGHGQSTLGAAEDKPGFAQPLQRCERDIVVNRQVHDQALLPPVLGDERDARRHGGGRLTVRQRLAQQAHRARGAAVNSEDRPGDLGAPGTHKTGKCDHLAPTDVETNVVEHVLPHELVDS